jgi:hypothetical protein
LDKIENLQTHSNSDIYHQAYEILEKFFSNEIVREISLNEETKKRNNLRLG